MIGSLPAIGPLEWRVRWSWDWPLWLSALMALVVVGGVAAIYFREVSPAGKSARVVLTLLRLTALALVLAMLAQPVVERFRMGRPHLVVLVDRSASMNTRDVTLKKTGKLGDLSRLEATKTLLTAGPDPLLKKWQSTYELEVVALDEQITGLDSKLQSLDTSGKAAAATRLGDAVDYALQELSGPLPTAIVLFTDGITTRGQPLNQAAQRARSLRVPLYTVAIGSPNKLPDIALENLVTEEVVFPGDRLQVEATLRATGYAGRQANVLLLETLQNQVLAQTTVELPPEGALRTVRLALRPEKPGKLSLQLKVEPLEGEWNVENNTVSQAVEVRDDKINVLFVQASPSYEYRALKSLLERDPAIELRVHLQEADADFSDVDEIAIAEFPFEENELLNFDVLLLGDVDPALLPSRVWPKLQRFVSEHGGGMVCIAGPRFMPQAFQDIRPLQVLLPFELPAIALPHSEVPRSIQPTALGWQTPSLQLGETEAESRAIWRSLPTVSWLYEVKTVKPGAQVLAEQAAPPSRQGDSLPAILRHYVGAGEVLFHATDETWRWRWRTDDRYFARYWGQVLRRLGRWRLAANRQQIVLRANRAHYRPGEEVRLQVQFRNPSEAPADNQGVVVHLQAETGSRREIRLRRRSGHRGVFEAVVRGLLPGKYEGMMLRPSPSGSDRVARFEIERPPRELTRVAVNRQGLAEAAKISGGKSYTLETVSELVGNLPPPRAVPIGQLPAQPLWNSHAAMALFVLVLTGEWLLRRRHGML